MPATTAEIFHVAAANVRKELTEAENSEVQNFVTSPVGMKTRILFQQLSQELLASTQRLYADEVGPLTKQVVDEQMSQFEQRVREAFSKKPTRKSRRKAG